MIGRIAAAACLVMVAAPASAQSAFGDTLLSYSGGVVTDDDLVPGRGPNQPYLADEQGGTGVYDDDYDVARENASPRRGRLPSRNLIRQDGRAIRD